MKYLLFLWSLSCSLDSHSQDNGYVAFRPIDIPVAETNSPASIAGFINARFKTEQEKFHAIYTWVTRNIRYDTDSMYIINWNMGREAKVTEAFRRRKGVCDNFAAIFNDIARKAGLVSFVVEGYTKQAGIIDKSGHSWCAVQLDGKWLLCDPTWDKDAISFTRYFLAEPAEFIQSHMPFDPMWQLQSYPYTHREFYRGIATKGNKDFFNYADSIKIFSRLNELQQLESTAARMGKGEGLNELVKARLAYTNMLIGINYEEKDMNLYNAAVADLNEAANAFNEFLRHRNNQFQPVINESEAYNLLNRADSRISYAYRKISQVGQVVPNPQYDPSGLRIRLNLLQQKLEDQKEFLKKYLAGNDVERKKMFYK